MTNKYKGTMKRTLNEIYTLFRRDEILMRLLHYPPANDRTGQPDPLSSILPNLVDEYSEEYWDLVDDVLLTAVKSPNIELDAMCRIYLYSGRRKPNASSYILADQEIVVDILVHDSYTRDIRNEGISDRVIELLALEEIVGVYGEVNYGGGIPRHAPVSYSSYEHSFTFMTNKKSAGMNTHGQRK